MHISCVPNFLRALCGELDNLRSKLIDPCGGTVFKDGLCPEDGKELAKLLSQPNEEIRAHELKCHVCTEMNVIRLEWYFAGHQDSDPVWNTLCVISGRKVRLKKSSREVYICEKCLQGREELEERVARAMAPALRRFDEISL